MLSFYKIFQKITDQIKKIELSLEFKLPSFYTYTACYILVLCFYLKKCCVKMYLTKYTNEEFLRFNYIFEKNEFKKRAK